MEDKNVIEGVVRKTDEVEHFAPDTRPNVLREYPPAPPPQPQLTQPQPAPIAPRPAVKQAQAAQAIRFVIDKSRSSSLTWEEYETIELAQEGEVKMRRLRPLVARFMVDANSQPIPHKQAMETLGKLPMEEVRDVFTKFAEAMIGSAVPNMSGTPLNSTSEAVSETSASLPG